MRERIRNLKCLWINEFHTTVAHISCIIGILIFMYNISIHDGIAWSIGFVAYYITLFFCSSAIFYDIENLNKYRRIYIIICLIIVITVGIFTSILESFLITVITALITFIYIKFANGFEAHLKVIKVVDIPANSHEIISSKNEVASLILDDSKQSIYRTMYEKHPMLYSTIYNISIILMVLIPIILLKTHVFVKIIIAIAYIVFIPIICLAADNGANIDDIVGI